MNIRPKHLAKTVARAVESADIAVTHALAGRRDNPAIRGAGAVSEISDQPPLIALSLAVLAGGLLLRSPGIARTGARMLAAHTLATALKTTLKRSIDRSRPDHALAHGYRLDSGSSDRHHLSSFPSGHSAGAVAIAEAIAREAPVIALPVRLLAASASIIQVPRAKHYVGDVLAGAAIGWLGARIAGVAIDAIDRRATSDS
ncbi:phosphatase PAP2 family protein [Sphingomonas japonica]|uniref:Undecaprenyl-diphosphatase n=1 Tax=Sphingomonas japonica TaxID=511662 RepID=A0ABX0U2I9_9SPHN|nr:phosphatase PAP2 family protein [Sphingomonas japonica]NIJ22938.1 undecaprenyl-diphosphatase [Sphingomonas japonica]